MPKFIARSLLWSLVIGSLWFLNVAAGIWLMQRYGLTPRPGDFEREAIFRMGLDVGLLEVQCLGLRPRWEKWHDSQYYTGMLLFRPPATCDELQERMEEAHPASSAAKSERRL